MARPLPSQSNIKRRGILKLMIIDFDLNAGVEGVDLINAILQINGTGIIIAPGIPSRRCLGAASLAGLGNGLGQQHLAFDRSRGRGGNLRFAQGGVSGRRCDRRHDGHDALGAVVLFIGFLDAGLGIDNRLDRDRAGARYRHGDGGRLGLARTDGNAVFPQYPARFRLNKAHADRATGPLFPTRAVSVVISPARICYMGEALSLVIVRSGRRFTTAAPRETAWGL